MHKVGSGSAVDAGPRDISSLEDRVDGAKNFLRRAERNGEVNISEPLAGRVDAILEIVVHPLEEIGVGSLKAVDRLLPVAHHKQRAVG